MGTRVPTDDISAFFGPDGNIDLPIPHPPTPPLFKIDEFNNRLRAWLKVEDSKMIGEHILTSAQVLVGNTLCRLAGDTTRAGVISYLERVADAEGLYSVVPSSEDVPRRVVPGRAAERVPGFYMYTQEPFEAPQVIQPVSPPLDHWSIAMLILDAVADLHMRGHQRLRVYPNISGSGLYWRTRVVDIDNLRIDPFGWPDPSSASFLYTMAARSNVGGILVDANSTPTEVADRVLAAFPDPHQAGRGRDWAYAGWYVEMLGLARRYHGLPVGDEPTIVDGRRHWRVGANATIDEPPLFGPLVR